MNDYTLVIAIANAATMLTGGTVALLADPAFRRTDAPALRAVAAGFGVIVAGSVLGGGVHLVGGAVGVALRSSVTALGFGRLLYSLYAETTGTTGITEISL